MTAVYKRKMNNDHVPLLLTWINLNISMDK